jgi:hypothetical protein
MEFAYSTVAIKNKPRELSLSGFWTDAIVMQDRTALKKE